MAIHYNMTRKFVILCCIIRIYHNNVALCAPLSLVTASSHYLVVYRVLIVLH